MMGAKGLSGWVIMNKSNLRAGSFKIQRLRGCFVDRSCRCCSTGTVVKELLK
jgi:hypothetical protein